MAKIHGKSGVVKVAGTNTVASVTNFEFEETIPTDDTTAQGDTGQTHLTGIPGFSGSLTCNLDQSDTDGQGAFIIGAELDLELYPAGDASSRKYRKGNATITSARTSTPLGVVTLAIDYLGQGALSELTVA